MIIICMVVLSFYKGFYENKRMKSGLDIRTEDFVNQTTLKAYRLTGIVRLNKKNFKYS